VGLVIFEVKDWALKSRGAQAKMQPDAE
jgi:hypothetical protein